MRECPVCGTDVPDGFRFCGTCGAALAAPPRTPEERKVVTTLFCDLVGFTAMGEAADPEDVAEVLGRYHELARRVIESHGGTVEKYIGDAVVGVFGVPTVHEDDAERAVRAGLRVLQALRDAGLTRPDGGSLEARAGVSTGEALVRLDVDPAAGRGFLTGDAVNTAARLQAAAPPMGVVAGHLAYELTREAIDYEPHPPVAAKGKAEPVEAWLAKQAHARTGLRTSGVSATPFLGRKAELAALDEALDEAVAFGEARFALVVGEPGIGKSRLALEFGHVLDARPRLTTWRIGRCLPYGDGVTFWALGEVVKEHAGILDSDDVATMQAKLDRSLAGADDVPWLRQRLRPLLGLEAPRAGRDENFAAWTGFLRLVASGRPAVVVLEDLHWAGDGMLAFMDHLLGQDICAPLLVVATARPELLQRHEGLLTSGDSQRLRRVTLPGLSARNAGALVSRLLDTEPPLDVRERVVSAAGGNPLYAEQYVRLLLDRGLVGGPQAKAAGGPSGEELLLPEALLPETLHAVLAARLDTLPPDHKALLADAAVLGETFWRGGVTALSGRDEAEVDEVMAVLCSRDLVRPAVASTRGEEPEYLFWHALTRDVAYGQLPRRVRARKHEAAAAWACGMGGEGSDEFAEIEAHHAVTAFELAQAIGDEALVSSLRMPAVRSLIGAGDRALRLDIGAAERHLAKALELSPEDAPERTALLTRWAKVLLLTNRYRESAAAYGQAVQASLAAGRTREAALALCWSADALTCLNEPCADVNRQAVELLEGDAPSRELAEVLEHYALALSLRDELPEVVMAAADRALATCEAIGAPVSAVSLSTRGWARLLRGDTAGLDDCRRAEVAAREQGLGIEQSTILINHSGLDYLVQGAEAEREALLEGLEFVRSHGIALHIGAFEVALLWTDYKTGRWEEALTGIDAALADLAAMEDVWDMLVLRSLQALILSRRGEPLSAAPWLDWLVTTARDCEIGWTRACAFLSVAAWRQRVGDDQTALDLVRGVLPRPLNPLANAEDLPEVFRIAAASGDSGYAQRLAEEYEAALPPETLPLQQHARVTLRALLAQERGEYAAAADGFARAAAAWRDFSQPYEEGQALLDQGRCLLRLERKEEAAPALRRAHEIFEGLGARPARDEAAELMAAAEVR